MNAAARTDWIGHPLAGALLRFSLLPSRLFHPSRESEWLPPQLDALERTPALHRHASARLLQRMHLGPVQSLDDPALPVCLAPDELFDHLTLCCGLVMLSPALRLVITRVEVAALQDQLGEHALQFARREGARLLGEPVPAMPTLQADTRTQALGLGMALVALAISTAPDDIARRGRLRLPSDAEAAQPQLPAPWADAARALSLNLSILQELDPAWLSSFPDPR